MSSAGSTLRVVCAGFISVLLFATTASADVLLDYVVAQVDDQIITHSEVLAETALVAMSDGRDPNVVLSEQGALPRLYQRVLELMINQIVITNEAQKLHQFPVSQEEQSQALDRFRKQFRRGYAYQTFLRRYALNDDRVREHLTRGIRVGRYLDYKVKTSLRITDEEVQRWLSEHPRVAERYLDPGLIARATLHNERYATLVNEWIDRLKAKAKVRLLRKPASAQ